MTDLLNMSLLLPMPLADIPIDYGILSFWSWRQPLNFLTQYSRLWKDLETKDALNTIDYFVCVCVNHQDEKTCMQKVTFGWE